MSKRYTNPFAPLELSGEDAMQLEGLADAFVRKTIAQSERFVTDAHSVVDAKRWKPVLEREDIHAFAERRNVPNEDALPDAPVTNTADLPVLLVVGTISGTLDDAMLGSVTPSLEAMRIKTSYIGDEIVGCAILATVVAPSAADPFRSLTIKWLEKGRPLHVRALVKNRDFVYMESTGITTLPLTGERVGYHLMHSVHFPQTPELDTVLRGSMSVCGIYRQRPGHPVVDCYARGVLNPAGGLMRSIVLKSAAGGLTSIWKYMHCAQMKKLTWLLRRRRAAYKDQRPEVEEDSNSSSSACRFCGKAKRSSLKALVTSKKKTTQRPTCRLCCQQVCSACRVQRTLHFLEHSSSSHNNKHDEQYDRHEVVQSVVTCCNTCVTDAMRLDARKAACDEFVLSNVVVWNDAYADSATSETSDSPGSIGVEFSPTASEASMRGRFE